MGKRATAFGQRQVQREAKLIDLCKHVKTSAELDTYLDDDAAIASNPALRAAVRGEIQRLVPHLRDL